MTDKGFPLRWDGHLCSVRTNSQAAAAAPAFGDSPSGPWEMISRLRNGAGETYLIPDSLEASG